MQYKYTPVITQKYIPVIAQTWFAVNGNVLQTELNLFLPLLTIASVV
jgi:hypothetical protein